jgi:predicted nuclease of restriction endonuclease-like (RecB) superfamily
MVQFYRLYRDDQIVAPLVRQLSWSHHLVIMTRCKRGEEREFYIRMAIHEHWGKLELERLLETGIYKKSKATQGYMG